MGNDNKQTLRLYWQQVRKYKTSFLIALILIPLGILLIDTTLPYFSSQAIGAMTVHDTASVARNIILTAIVGIGGVLCNLVGFQALTRHEASVTHDLSNATFRSLIRKDMAFFTNHKVGGLTTKFIDFIRSEVSLQDLLIIRTLGFILSVGAGIVIIAVQMWPLALLMAMAIAFLLVEVKWSTRKRAAWRESRRSIRSTTFGNIADAVTNSLIVKTFANESDEEQAIARQNSAYRSAHIKDIGFLSYEGGTRVGVMTTLQIVAMAACAYFVAKGMLAISVAVFVLAYMQRVGSQLFTLGEMLNGYDQALLDAQPMTKILSRPDSVIDADNATPLVINKPRIEFDAVSYAYDGNETPVINQLSLTIPEGQKVGLVGMSGAGKTTITHLLLRFDDVTSGAIRIDAQDVRHVTQESLRKTIAYVPQEPLLFHRSLRDNIVYGNPTASEQAIRQAIIDANAAEFIDKLPDGLDTLVGERGVKLSGGQRQRIAIARAILKDAPILVLDEATSALDSESEKLIQDALGDLMKGRTSIVVAHRLSTIAKLDRIIVLDHGVIVEDGSHAELLAQQGIYAKLWKHQSGGFIEE